jgi:hypothetical protein
MKAVAMVTQPSPRGSKVGNFHLAFLDSLSLRERVGVRAVGWNDSLDSTEQHVHHPSPRPSPRKRGEGESSRTAKHDLRVQP